MSGSNASTSTGDKLKKAISDALAKAESKRRAIAKKIAIATLRLIGCTLI